MSEFKTVETTSTLDSLKWRYATKRMNGKAVPEEEVQKILESIRFSASSYGLQPYKVVVVDDEATKEKLKAAAYGQAQLTESSHVLVFAIWDDITQEQIDHFILTIAHQRNISVESLAGYKGMIEMLLNLPTDQKQAWNAKQSYIGLGSALIQAAESRIDSCPMEGFSAPQFDEILGLKEKGLKSVAILCLGYRDTANDYLAAAPKVRYPQNEFIIRNK